MFGYNRTKLLPTLGFCSLLLIVFWVHTTEQSAQKKLYIVLCLHDCCLCDYKIAFYSTALNKTWGRVHRKIDAATNAWDMRGTSLKNFDTRMNTPPQLKWATNAARKLCTNAFPRICCTRHTRRQKKRWADNVQCAVYLLQYVCLNYCGMNFYQKYKSYVSVVHEERWTGLVGIYCDSHYLLVHFCIHKEVTSGSFIYVIL